MAGLTDLNIKMPKPDGTFEIPPETRDIAPEVLDDNGRLKILPAAYWATTAPAEPVKLPIEGGGELEMPVSPADRVVIEKVEQMTGMPFEELAVTVLNELFGGPKCSVGRKLMHNEPLGGLDWQTLCYEPVEPRWAVLIKGDVVELCQAHGAAMSRYLHHREA